MSKLPVCAIAITYLLIANKMSLVYCITAALVLALVVHVLGKNYPKRGLISWTMIVFS